jgi:hypothetical protein
MSQLMPEADSPLLVSRRLCFQEDVVELLAGQDELELGNAFGYHFACTPKSVVPPTVNLHNVQKLKLASLVHGGG